MRIVFHGIVNLATAAMMLAQTTMVHGISHAHEGGHKCHGHADAVVSDHDHNSHRHDESSEFQHDCESYLSPASTRHTHFTFLGFEFTFPDFDDSPSKEDNPKQLRLVCLIDDFAIELARSQETLLLRPLSHNDSSREIVTSPSSEVVRAQVPNGPLCDAARYERTGVLLI